MKLLTIYLSISMIQSIELYVEDWMTKIKHCKSYKTRLQKAKSYIPTLVRYSEYYDIDPWLSAIMVTRESGWKSYATGRKGEQGLLQLMPKFFKNYNLHNPIDQIHAGIKHLKKSKEICGNIPEKMLTYYKCNRCMPIDRKMKERSIYYTFIKRKYGKKD